ncbi:MAG: glutamine synthetase family protein [archaeon]
MDDGERSTGESTRQNRHDSKEQTYRQEVEQRMKKENVAFLQLQFTDLFGMVKSITLPADRLDDALTHGAWFDGSSIEGFARIQESDMRLKPDLSTYARVPWLDSEKGNTARFICDVVNPDGSPFVGDPRYVLHRAVQHAKESGFTYCAGPELEFFLLKENGHGHLPHDDASYFDNTTDLAHKIRNDMLLTLRAVGITDEAAHHEVAVGQHEIDFMYDEAMKTADNTITVKSVIKAVAEQHNLYATFMPKPFFGMNGSGMHIHQSLFMNGKNAFYDERDPYKLSPLAKQFIAGQLEHARAMSAILSPLVNSYKRLVPGYEAPVYIVWASNNRSALIRVPKIPEGKSSSSRAELRCPDPSANIYLALAVMLEAGLDGIRKQATIPSPFEENMYHLNDAQRAQQHIAMLPGSLGEAIGVLEQDAVIRNALGGHIIERYGAAKRKECDAFRTAVTDWEVHKYLSRY